MPEEFAVTRDPKTLVWLVREVIDAESLPHGYVKLTFGDGTTLNWVSPGSLCTRKEAWTTIRQCYGKQTARIVYSDGSGKVIEYTGDFKEPPEIVIRICRR